ncbi:MAG: hypothetical protein HOM44_14240 [Gammaproteobacteria bacterium]|jgi:hypothetical protein|nr:hypothetical protein [Gammaproteobacteria bacterium]MDG1233397.1 hypothetical protein [Pseudomonadales bacterium]MBT5685885.1 hypothetical protein [Gammaproteobacteria bacterium]MBT5724632.1 hypothetical protein [Gammaproteobacteria bacterium]MBT6890049.1 hypothetical protein [Gammaproteobacteria bacterium]
MTDQKLTILIVVVVVLVLGILVFRNWPQLSEEEFALPLPEKTSSAPKRSTLVKAVLTECNKRPGARTTAKGHITNVGNVDLHYVTVKLMWLNSVGLLVEAKETYALNNEILPPGESRSFIGFSQKVSAVRCNVETVDWW